jgi:hypothetical protein
MAARFLRWALLAAFLALFLWKGPHAYWRWWQRVPAVTVPTKPLLSSAAPRKDWVCQVGSVSIQLAPEWLRDVHKMDAGLRFQDGPRQVLVVLPQKPAEELSPCKLREAAYRASTDDFRWSMSLQELARLQTLLTFKGLACADGVQSVETVYRSDIEGLLLVLPRGCSFEWVSTDGKASGQVMFLDRSGKVDLSWVRPICASLRFSGETFPRRPAPETLQRLLERAKAGRGDAY